MTFVCLNISFIITQSKQLNEKEYTEPLNNFKTVKQRSKPSMESYKE